MTKIFIIFSLNFPVKSHKDLEGRSNVGFPSSLLQLAKLDFGFVRSKFRPPCTPRKFLGTQFQLETV
jgi:hypothetical protein